LKSVGFFKEAANMEKYVSSIFFPRNLVKERAVKPGAKIRQMVKR